MARKSRKYSEDVPFSLTSMMDMMTIILASDLDLQGPAEGSVFDCRGRC